MALSYTTPAMATTLLTAKQYIAANTTLPPVLAEILGHVLGRGRPGCNYTLYSTEEMIATLGTLFPLVDKDVLRAAVEEVQVQQMINIEATYEVYDRHGYSDPDQDEEDRAYPKHAALRVTDAPYKALHRLTDHNMNGRRGWLGGQLQGRPDCPKTKKGYPTIYPWTIWTNYTLKLEFPDEWATHWLEACVGYPGMIQEDLLEQTHETFRDGTCITFDSDMYVSTWIDLERRAAWHTRT